MVNISEEELFRALRRKFGSLPTADGTGGLTVYHVGRLLVLKIDKAKGQVHLCIERHPPDLEDGIPMLCWQFWVYDATNDELDYVEEVPALTTDGLSAIEEHGKSPRKHLSAKELAKIKNASSLPASLWPLQQNTRDVAHILGITSQQVLRLRDWGLLREVDKEQIAGPYWTCVFNAVEVEEFKQLYPDIGKILGQRSARRQLEYQRDERADNQ